MAKMRRGTTRGTTEETEGEDMDGIGEAGMERDKANLSEEDLLNKVQGKDANRGSCCRTIKMLWRMVQQIVDTVLVQDDDPLYGRGTLGVFSGVYISYLQNIVLLNIIFIRLPWIVGVLSLVLASGSILIVFSAVFFSSFSILAIATNGSDRLYGGPFTTIAYSLGDRVAFVAGIMFCIANCGFTALNLTLSTELIGRFTLGWDPVSWNSPALAFQNAPTVIRELCYTSCRMHLIMSLALLGVIASFTAFGKRFIKWICWVPSAAFIIILAGIMISVIVKKVQKDIDLRCVFEPYGTNPRDRYFDQLPVTFYLPSNYTNLSSIQPLAEPSLMKRYCKCPFPKANCTLPNVNDCCTLGDFRLEIFEWNFKLVRSNFDYHTIESKYASVAGCALLLLPLFTGSVCGINIPSILKSPTKNIPTGIFSSLITMFCLITLLTFLLAFGVERHLLLDKYGHGAFPIFPVILSARYSVVLIVGLIVMSVVSAIQSLYTAKSLLLSVITSHMMPIPRFFYKRTSKWRTLLAVGITSLLVIPFLFINNADYIAIVASSSMVVALIIINMSTIVCSALHFPSFQPAFTLFRSFLSMFGIVCCSVMLYGCKPLFGMATSIVAFLIYVICLFHKRQFWRGTRHDVIIDIANMLLYSSTHRNSALMTGKFYLKPRCIIFTRFPAPCDNLLRMAKILSQNRCALCLSLIRDSGDQENIGLEDVRTARQCMEYIDLSGYVTQFKYQKISSLHSIASALASCCGLGVFRSNTVMIEYPSEAALSGLPDSLLYHYHMHRVCVQHSNLVIVKGTFPLKIEPVQPNQTIDIWWIIDNGDVLLMVAKMLKQHKIWHKAKLRLFLVVEIDDDIKQIEKALLLWLVDNHYLLHKIECIRADPAIIQEYVQLRALQIKQRYCEINKKTFFSHVQRLLGVPDGRPVQNAVDSGFRQTQTNLIQSSFAMKVREQTQRTQQLNKEILERSSHAALVLINIPEPPVYLERFWKYLNFLNSLSSKLKKVLFVRGVDVKSNVDMEASVVNERVT